MEERLIMEVSFHPVLYDQNIEGYKDKDMKNIVWMEVARKVLNRDDVKAVHQIKLRWKTLRDSFVKAHRAAKRIDGKRKKTWRFQTEMQFLAPFIQKSTRSSLLNMDSAADEGDEEITVKFENVDGTPCDDSAQSLQGPGFPQEISHPFQSPNMHMKQNNTIAESRPTVQEGTEKRQLCVDSGIDLFFQSIAQTVKLLKPMHQILIQREVSGMVLEYKLRELQGRDPQSNYSSGSNSSVSAYNMWTLAASEAVDASTAVASSYDFTSMNQSLK